MKYMKTLLSFYVFLEELISQRTQVPNRGVHNSCAFIDNNQNMSK